MIKEGKLRAEKIEYKDGVGCCVWYPLGAEEGEDYDEETGICFDFNGDDIDDFILLLQKLKKIEPEIFQEEEEE